MTIDIENRIRRGESFILAADGRFLGKLTSNKYDVESIYNQYGIYGSKYSGMSIWNKFCPYGSPYSIYSPYNSFSTTPPQLFLRGVLVGYLTTNKYINNNVNPAMLALWIKNNNL